MIGITIEASTTCTKCGEQAAINAMVPGLLCIRCGAVMNLSTDDWNTIIADALKEAPRMEEGEGRNSTIFSDPFSFKVLYGRQAPQFRDTKKPIDMAAAVAGAGAGFVEDPETKTRRSVRAVPPEYAAKFPGITHLLCEDFDQLPGANGGYSDFHFPKSEGPQPFACPQCGGSLQLDGTERKVKCTHCGTISHIPDELWLKLHPAKLISRWYLWFDETLRSYEWESDLWDIVADGEDNLYITHETAETDKLTLVSLGPDLKPRWVREDLEEFVPKTSNGDPKLSLAPEGRLLLWSGDRHALLTLSCADGKELDRLGGSRGRTLAGDGTFSMKQAKSMAVDTDGTIIAFMSRDKKDVDDNSFCELVRYSADGAELPFWPESGEKKGILGKVMSFFSDWSAPGYFEGIGNRVINIRDHDVVLSVGLDGNYYLLSFDKLARYDRGGEKIYGLKLPCGHAWGRACADAGGNAFVLCSGTGEDHFILRISPSGEDVRVHVPYVAQGGGLCQEEALAMSSDGTLYAAGFDGRLRTFSAEGKLLHASDRSREDEAEALKKARDEEE
jgi:DNA-directed RNA polymerase subunit RPC12/RpoP